MSKKDVSPVLEELSKNYNFHETPELVSAIQNLLSEIYRFINDLLRHFRVPIAGDTNTSALADLLQFGLIAAGVICVIILIFISYNKVHKLKLKSRGEFKGAEETEEKLDSSGWQNRAEGLAEKEEWSKACRAIYLSLLYLLDERSVLKYTPTRSNYEYWYALSTQKSIQKPFRELADLVDLIWFGEYTASESDYNACSELKKKIVEDTPQIKT